MVGIVSDLTVASFDQRSLSVALSLSMLVLLGAALFYYLTGKAMHEFSDSDQNL